MGFERENSVEASLSDSNQICGALTFDIVDQSLYELDFLVTFIWDYSWLTGIIRSLWNTGKDLYIFLGSELKHPNTRIS